MRRWPAVCAVAGALAIWPAASADAEVRRVVIESRSTLPPPLTGGPAPVYEKLAGHLELRWDPAHAANRPIVDLDRAQRGSDGLVEAKADFMVLRPRDGGRDGIALVEVSNRGGKALLPYFDGAAWSLDPRSPAELGDGLLLRLGFTIIWVGWQFDVPRRPGLLRLDAPIASDGERPIEGLVRSDWTVEQPVRTLPLAHRDHVAYPVANPDAADSVLTVRDGRLSPRRVVDRARWRFGREMDGRLVADRQHVYLAEGFEPGRIYELVYRARDPVVVGLGLATVRDIVAHAKHAPDSSFPVARALAVGISQSGRFLRHFVFQGLNADEAGRRVFDGMLVHTAGAGRGSFNHRFAQPSRDAHRFSAFFYPTDLFPFSGRAQRDPETGREDGLLAHLEPEHRPRVMYTNTGYEYWGRAASLLHTSLDGRHDVAPLPGERLYHLASAQHYVGRFPPSEADRLAGADAYGDNPVDFLVTLRALLVHLRRWVVEDIEPPTSAFPTIGAGTLVPVDRLRFPRIPGVTAPRVAHEAYRVDYGPRWPREITREPPHLGRAFPALVPQVDADGNERSGLRGLELLVPVATFAPWSLRGGAPGPPGELRDFLGTTAPFARTARERRQQGDPRPSLEERYRTRAGYLEAARRALDQLVAGGLVLEEDRAALLARAEALWDWAATRRSRSRRAETSSLRPRRPRAFNDHGSGPRRRYARHHR
jgi:hypothetical protein